MATPRTRHYRVILALAVVGAVATIALGGMSTLERRELTRAGEGLAVAASGIADELAIVLHERTNDVTMLARTLATDPSRVAFAAGELKAARERSPFYLWMAVTDVEGRILAATAPVSSGLDRSESRWFTAARDGTGPQVLDTERSDDVVGAAAGVIAIALRDETQTFRGVLVAFIGDTPLEATFARRVNDIQAQLSTSTRVDWVLLRRDGIVIGDSGGTAGDDLKARRVPSALLSDALVSGHVLELASDGVPVVTGYAHVSAATNAEELHWRVLLRRERHEVLEALHRSLGFAMLALLIVLMPTSLAIWLARRSRRRAEVARALAHARLQAIVDNAWDAILVTDLEGRIHDFNPAAERMFGWTRGEAVGYLMHDLILPEGAREAHRQELERFRASGEGLALGTPLELAAIRRNGETFPTEAVTTLATPTLFCAVIRDISQRRQLETELRQAQKLESVGQLAAGVAHEINTPIQFVGDNIRFLDDSVTSLLDLVRNYARTCDELAQSCRGEDALESVRQMAEKADLGYLEEEIPKAIAETKDGVDRVATIVRAMKNFAHQKTSNEPQPADVNEALRSTLTVARSMVKYHAAVETDLGDLPPVVCHVDELNQVFLNLLVNAAHAIEDVVGGSGAMGRIVVRTRHEGDMVVVSVSDTGCGIPPEVRPRIFDPFYTTKQVGRGTGQGLSIAHNIVVEGHGGRLTFETEVGTGTTFYVHLPVEATMQATA